MKNLLTIVWLLFFVQTFLSAQSSKIAFLVEQENPEVYVDEIFELVYSVESEGLLPKEHNLEFPTWNGLSLIRSPMDLKRSTIISGKLSSAIITTFIFSASDTGIFVFPPATFTFNDTIIQSDPIKVVVLPALPLTDSLFAEQIFIRTELHPAKAMVGEQIRLDVRVYGLNLPHIENYDLLNEPHVTGLNIEKESYGGQVKEEDITVDGKLFSSYVIFRKSISAYHEGKFEIPSLRAEVTIREDDERGSFFSKGKKKLLKSDPVELEVYMLDEEYKTYPPANGTDLDFKIIDTALNRGIIHLEVTVKGKGDPLFFSPPFIGLEKVAKVKLVDVKEVKSINPSKVENRKLFTIQFLFLKKVYLRFILNGILGIL